MAQKTKKKKVTVPAKRTAKPPATKDAVTAVDLREQTLSNIIIKGDISSLTPAEKIEYYKAFCAYVGLNPVTQPFSILRTTENGVVKEVLYAKKEATEQLRMKQGISITSLHGELVGGVVYRVVATGANGQGRVDSASGAVNVQGLKGDRLSNAIMKAETKAKRRLTLSLAGLGMLDEAEIDSIPGAMPVTVQGEPVESQILPGETADPDHPTRQREPGDDDPPPQPGSIPGVQKGAHQQQAPQKAPQPNPEKAKLLVQMKAMLDNCEAEGLLTNAQVLEAKGKWNKTKTLEDARAVYMEYRKLADDAWTAKKAEAEKNGPQGTTPQAAPEQQEIPY